MSTTRRLAGTPVADLLARVAAAQEAIRAAPAADVLAVACREARELVGADSAVVGTAEGEEVLARAVEGPHVPGPGDRVPVAGTLVGTVLRTGQPQRCDDAADDPRTDAVRNRRQGIRSSVVAPLVQDGRALGVLAAFSGRRRWFDDTDLALLVMLAGATSARLGQALQAVEHDEVRGALAETERRLASAQELTGLAWWQYDVGTDRHLWSAQMYRLVGLPPGGPAPSWEGYLALVHPEDRAACRRHAAAMATGGAGRTQVFRVVHPDGTVRTLQAWSEARTGVDGKLRSIFGTTLDVTEREEAARALRESGRRIAEAQELTGLAWWEWDVRTGSLAWSDGMHRLAGLEPGTAAPTIEAWLALVHPEDRRTAEPLERRAVEEGVDYKHVFRVCRPDGSMRYLQSWTTPVRDADGTVRALRGATLDVTAQQEAARALEAGEAHFRIAFDNAPIGMTLISLQPGAEGRILRVNDALCRMLGRDRQELLERSIRDWTHPDHLAEDERRLARLASGEAQGMSFEKRYLHRDGHAIHAWVNTAVVADGHGAPLYLISHTVDVTERRRAQQELERLALTDTLTGLANRSLLDDRLRQALRRLSRGRGQLAVLLLDIDRFKLVNDSLGHHSGDLLLQEVARRLGAVTRSATTVARLGGDEFVVLVDDVADPAEVEHVARRILASLRRPYHLSTGETVVTSASLGIATAGSPERTPEDLYREADLALYRAKDTGRDRYAVFDADLRARVETRIDTEARLRRALAQGGLEAVFQPVVDLGTGATVAMEALVRLRDPELGLLLPEAFVDVAEDTGLVAEIDTWVVEHAVARLARLRAAAGVAPGEVGEGRVPAVAVNVAVRTLEQPAYVPRLRAALRRHGVPGSLLLVEITERTLMGGSPAVCGALAQLAEMGVRVGIDDFGTGYSALAYLQRFDLNFLKIDRSFVSRLGRSPRDDALVAAVIDLAHAHGLVVTAEGVETAEHAAALRAMGCEQGQGWLFGRPAGWE